MLRPIDTQTIYQQSQEVSNRQQAHRQGEDMQQMQFAHLLQKETKEKREVVKEIQQDEKVDNELNKKKKGQHNEQEKKNAKKQTKEKKDVVKEQATHFDARI